MKMIILFILSVLSVQHTAEGTDCKRITEPLCQDVGYDLARFPNGLGHRNSDQARFEFYLFRPLFDVRCSDSLKKFICSVYFPECQNGGKAPLVLPSRRVCEDSYTGCIPILRKFGYKWPRSLNCQKFPGFYDTTTSSLPQKRKPLNIPSVFELKQPEHKIQVRFSPGSITFPSCCAVYYYTSKEVNVTPDTELFVRTADVRITPEVTIQKIVGTTRFLGGKYLTLLMVNHYMSTIYDKQLYVNWMIVNIINEDVATGITMKEYDGPRPSITTSDAYHFLLYQHSKPVDIFSTGNFTSPYYSRHKLDLKSLFGENESHLTAIAKMKVDIDEYVRFREVNEFAFSEQDVCHGVQDYPQNCNRNVAAHSVYR